MFRRSLYIAFTEVGKTPLRRRYAACTLTGIELLSVDWSSYRRISHKVENGCVYYLPMLCEGFHKWLDQGFVMCVVVKARK